VYIGICQTTSSLGFSRPDNFFHQVTFSLMSNSQTLKCLTSLLMSQATIEFHRFCEHDRNNISPLPG
ncbi:hypothetical protein ACVWBO_21940, partial [Escherichia coli]